MYIYTATVLMKYTLLLRPMSIKNSRSLSKSASGRGTRTRTQNKGFGDPRVTITPYPYVVTRLLYIITCQPKCQAEIQIFCNFQHLFRPGSVFGFFDAPLATFCQFVKSKSFTLVKLAHMQRIILTVLSFYGKLFLTNDEKEEPM